MSVIKRKELVTDEAINWPKEYKKDLEEIIAISKKLGQPANQPKVPGSDPKTRKNLDELQRVQNQLAKATERSSKEFLDQKAALDKLNKTNREAVKDINAQTDAYDKLDRELNTTRKAYKNLAAAGKENTTEAKKLLAQTKRLDSQLKRIDSTVGQNQRSVGKYSDALKGVTARFLGWAAVAATLFRALKSGIQIVLNYSKANSTLNAILNKTKKETEALRKQQQELGKATAFSATQVTKAQTELARLGLTMEEITALTPSILDAAVAFGVDMAQAAELVAGQLNAFNLSASQGKRVADVLTRATQISAFSFQRLQDALKVVSPAANAVNATIEDTVGILTAAVDANIEAGTASTALRNIFIDLSDKGLTWDQAMTQINTSTNKLSTANELFGKRGAVVATVIADNTTKINQNIKALENAAGAAEKFANEQLDNLSGDIVLLTSAWEGFILSLEKGDGVLARVARSTIKLFTATLGALNRAAEGTTLEFELWKERIVGFNLSNEDLNKAVLRTVNNINKEQGAVDDLNEKLIENAKLQREIIDQTGQVILNNSISLISDREVSEERIKNLKDQRDFLLKIGSERTALLDAEVAKQQEAEDKKQKVIDAANAKIAAEKAKLEALLKDLTFKGLEDSRSAFLQEVEAKKEALDTIKRIEQKLANDLIAINKSVTKSNEEEAERRVKAAEEEAKEKARAEKLLAEIKAEIIDKSFELASESANRFTDLRIQQIGQELTALEFARDRELERFKQTETEKNENFAGNKRKEAEINKKFDAERRQLLQKQANAEKANALFQIAINTAVGIAKTIASVGFPLAIPLIVLAAAIGAVQAAAVIAAPIPQFDEGTERTPSGKFMVSEKRPEFMKHQGKWSLIKEPTMFKNSPGDKIIGGKETDSILGTMSDLTGKNVLSDSGLMLGLLNNDLDKKKSQPDLAYIIKKGNDDVVRAITRKKTLNISVSNTRTDVIERVGDQKINRIDALYRGIT